MAYDLRGNTAKAEEYYIQALARDPRFFLALINLAILEARSGDHQAAIRGFKKAIRVAPLHAPAYDNLAVEYMRIGDLKNALFYF